jgi:hypothetical protein
MSMRPGCPDDPAATDRDMDGDFEQSDVAVSPATGPLPAIYVSRPGEADISRLLWRAATRSACRVGGWAGRHLRRSM